MIAVADDEWWRELAPDIRPAVSCRSVDDVTSGRSCLGISRRESGHSLVPEPPDNIAG